MGLSDVPTEILLCIADQLQNSWQVNSLGQTCRGFHKILNPYLYLFNKRCSRTSVLYHGIRKGLHSSVERLLPNMVSSKVLDEVIFMKGLEIAIQDGQLHMVELLIQAAADVPELSHWPTLLGMEQDTLFWQAASAPNESIVKLLLQHGVVPHSEPARWGDVRIAFWMHPSVIMAIIDTTRWRAEPESLSLSDVFFYALRFPSSRTAEIIKCLIEKGVDPNLPSGDGETPLCMAIRNKTNDAARCLLENGASSEAPRSLTYPLNLALWEGETETAKLLLERLNPSDILAKGGCVDLLFCAAAACGAERILEELLQRGCHPDTTMEFPMTLDRPEYPAIFWAVRHKQEETFRLLLKHGATPYPIVLTEASHCGNALIAEMLLHAGADPNWDQGPYFIMPYPLLLQALPDEHVFRVILNAGAVLPEEWPWDRLLGRALENRQIPQVEMLLNRGISFDKHGNELLARAAYGGTQMLELVARVADERHETLCGPSSTSPLEIAVCRSDFAAFKWLMDKRLCEVPDGDYLRYLLLRILDKFEFHHAEQAFDMLVKCGADINAPIPSAPSRWRWIMPIVPGSPFAWKIVLQTDEAVVKAFLDRGLNPISGTGASSEDVPPRYGSSKSLDLVLQWVLSQYPHGQAKPVLSSMKTRAEQEEQWGDLRQIYRFEDSNGLA